MSQKPTIHKRGYQEHPVKSPLKTELLARVAREHNLATKHYKIAFESYMNGAKLQAAKEKLVAVQHSRKAKSLECQLIPGMHFDEDGRVSLQSAWRFMP